MYKSEWDEYAKELGGKFKMHVALSREENVPKTYVQQLLKEEGDRIGDALVSKKGYAYIWFVLFSDAFLMPFEHLETDLLCLLLATVEMLDQWPRRSNENSLQSSAKPRENRSKLARRNSNFSRIETVSYSM